MNSITADSRVKKAAATAVRAGCDTRVFGVDATAWTTSLGEAVLERVAPDRRRRPLLTRSSGRWTLAPFAPFAYRDQKTLLRQAHDLLVSADRTPVGRARRFVHRVRRRLLYGGSTLSFGRVDDECLESFIERRLPHLRAESIALADAVAAFDPDLIHAHDVTAMQIPRLIEERHGQTIPWVYDAHELVRGISSTRPSVDQALVDLEAWLAPAATEVLAVSEPLGEALAGEHVLRRAPRIVLNAPPSSDLEGDSIRASCGLDPDDVLLVYPGVVKPARGLETVIEMLKLSDSVHLALVTDQTAATLEELLEMARRCRVEHRVHVRPY
ncbi:MAG: glycosyltransferase, partial [Myxococcota bacterium]|nr:glycosyltransferase [Myxococcota bacterium]